MRRLLAVTLTVLWWLGLWSPESWPGGVSPCDEEICGKLLSTPAVRADVWSAEDLEAIQLEILTEHDIAPERCTVRTQCVPR
ncbi:MAG TPA: hypothetical protein VJJ22_02010 [Candidatus Paceibacterota bacterium]